MVSIQLCVVYLAVLLFPESFSKPVSLSGNVREERSDDPQPLQITVENMANTLARLGATLTAMENELSGLRGKRCETGQVDFVPHAQPNTISSDGSESRTHKVHVNFARPFASTPWVSVGLNRLDEYNTANLRIDVTSQAVSTSGFDAVAFEWADTNILSARASWVACDL